MKCEECRFWVEDTRMPFVEGECRIELPPFVVFENRYAGPNDGCDLGQPKEPTK